MQNKKPTCNVACFNVISKVVISSLYRCCHSVQKKSNLTLCLYLGSKLLIHSRSYSSSSSFVVVVVFKYFQKIEKKNEKLFFFINFSFRRKRLNKMENCTHSKDGEKTLSPSLSLPLSFPLSLSLTHTHTHSLSIFLSPSLSHIHTRSLSPSLSFPVFLSPYLLVPLS